MPFRSTARARAGTIILTGTTGTRGGIPAGINMSERSRLPTILYAGVALLLIGGWPLPARGGSSTPTGSTTPTGGEGDGPVSGGETGGTAMTGDLHITIRNGADARVTQLYISRVGTNDWDEDILGDDAIDAGQTMPITINGGRKSCQYDVKAVLADGRSVQLPDQNLCSTPDLQIH